MFLLLATLLFAAPEEVSRVEVVWRGEYDEFPATGTAHVRNDEDVWLGPLLFFKDGTCSVKEGVYRDPDGVDRVCARPFTSLQDWRAQYWRVAPAELRVKRSPRGDGPSPVWKRTLFAAARPDRPVLAASDDGDGLSLGCMRYAVTLSDPEGNQVTSPAEDNPREALAVAVRLDDSWMGVMWELQGVPVVDGPRGVPPARHDTSMLWGMDANTAVVYAARRMGLALAYVDLTEQPGMETVDPATGPFRRGDVLIRGAQPVVLLAPSLAADVPTLTISDVGVRVDQLGKVDRAAVAIRRFTHMPAALPERELRKLKRNVNLGKRDAGPVSPPAHP
jgi:hypothetical protein